MDPTNPLMQMLMRTLFDPSRLTHAVGLNTWLYNNIDPDGSYPRPETLPAILKHATGIKKDPLIEASYFRQPGSVSQGDPYWAKFLGINDAPQPPMSKYKPTKASNPDAEYVGLTESVRRSLIQFFDLEQADPKQWMDGYQGKSVSSSTGSDALGRATIDLGVDERGPYLAIYDKYDFDTLPLANKVGRPYEIYDRIYFNEVSKPTPKQVGNDATKSSR